MKRHKTVGHIPKHRGLMSMWAPQTRGVEVVPPALVLAAFRTILAVVVEQQLTWLWNCLLFIYNECLRNHRKTYSVDIYFLNRWQALSSRAVLLLLDVCLRSWEHQASHSSILIELYTCVWVGVGTRSRQSGQILSSASKKDLGCDGGSLLFRFYLWCHVPIPFDLKKPTCRAKWAHIPRLD